jgi:hypothetical protein
MEKFTLEKYKQLLEDKVNQYYDQLDIENDIKELERMMNQKADDGKQNPVS